MKYLDDGGKQGSKHPKFKWFSEKYNKSYANLNNRGAKDSHSHMTGDEKSIVVFHHRNGYNVYDIAKDEWLLSQNNKNIDIQWYIIARSTLINDEILAIIIF